MKSFQNQQGLTLLEMLVALGLSVAIIGGVLQQYTATTALSFDHSIRVSTMLEAQALLQAIGSEIRMIGNGVPFDQPNFQIGEDTLTDPTVTEPINVAATTTTNLVFRLNETGDVALLTGDFDPSVSLSFTLTDVSALDVNDPIYISNSVVSGVDGLYGIVSAVDSATNTVTLNAGYVASPGATFPMGSILEEVPSITYASSGNIVTRDSGFGAVTMSDNSSLTFQFLDQNGNDLGATLNNDMVVDQLRAIRVTIVHNSSKNMKNGQPFSATVQQVFGIRNLNYLY